MTTRTHDSRTRSYAGIAKRKGTYFGTGVMLTAQQDREGATGIVQAVQHKRGGLRDSDPARRARQHGTGHLPVFWQRFVRGTRSCAQLCAAPATHGWALSPPLNSALPSAASAAVAAIVANLQLASPPPLLPRRDTHSAQRTTQAGRRDGHRSIGSITERCKQDEHRGNDSWQFHAGPNAPPSSPAVQDMSHGRGEHRCSRST